MCIVDVEARRVMLRLRGDEMPSGGAGIARLVRRVLEERGLEPWSSVEAECFMAGEEILLMARPGPVRLRGFWFGSLEHLLGAAFLCPAGESALYGVEGGYLLVLPPEGLHPALYEYGEECAVHPDWPCHAREQGQCILEENAIAQLVRIFSTAPV